MVLSCVILPATGSAEVPEGYDPHDYQKLVSFLELPNGGGKNGDRISENYDPDHPSTWGGVTWSAFIPKKVTRIEWKNKGLIGSLDVNGFTELEYLDCSNDGMPGHEMNRSSVSEQLAGDCNQLSSLNAGGCSALEVLRCDNNQLGSLNVSGCSVLEILSCNSNQLSSLSVSGCPALEVLSCSNNELTSLDVSGCQALAQLDCGGNQLAFADLPPTPQGGAYDYGEQSEIVIGSGGVVMVGEEIDLSAYASVAGVDTVFTWRDGQGVITPATANGGKFAFGWAPVGKTVYCEMTNSAYQGLTLRTTAVRIDPTHQITFIKPTDANDENNPLNINSGSLVIARIDGDMSAVDTVTVSLDGVEEQQAAVAGGIVYYLLPAGLESGQHTITLELTTKDGGRISASVTFHWNSYRRGFGFGRFDLGDVDEQ